MVFMGNRSSTKLSIACSFKVSIGYKHNKPLLTIIHKSSFGDIKWSKRNLMNFSDKGKHIKNNSACYVLGIVLAETFKLQWLWKTHLLPTKFVCWR